MLAPLNTNNQNICVIPARGGSKRIPRKNIKLFGGKPMIAWSIQAAIDARCFDRILVSTDDQEIAEVAINFGAEIPFLRHKNLADDFTPVSQVLRHAISTLFDAPFDSDHAICCLFATAPFVNPTDISRGLDLLKSSKSETVVFSATTFPFPIQRAIRLDKEGYSTSVDPASFPKRSQDLEECFHDAAQFYWASADTWSSKDNLFEGGRAIVLPRWRVQDIDTEEDWKHAELMHFALENTSTYN